MIHFGPSLRAMGEKAAALEHTKLKFFLEFVVTN